MPIYIGINQVSQIYKGNTAVQSLKLESANLYTRTTTTTTTTTTATPTTSLAAMNIGAWGDPHLYIRKPQTLNPSDYTKGVFLAKWDDNKQGASGLTEIRLIDLQTTTTTVKIFYTNKEWPNGGKVISSIRVELNGNSTTYTNNASVTAGPINMKIIRLGSGSSTYLMFEANWSAINNVVQFKGAINVILKRISSSKTPYMGTSGRFIDGFTLAGQPYGLSRSSFETNNFGSPTGESAEILSGIENQDFIDAVLISNTEEFYDEGMNENGNGDPVSVWDDTHSETEVIIASGNHVPNLQNEIATTTTTTTTAAPTTTTTTTAAPTTTTTTTTAAPLPPLSTEYSTSWGGTATPYAGAPGYLNYQSSVYSGNVNPAGSLNIGGVDYTLTNGTDWVNSTAGGAGTMVTALLQSAGLGNAASDFTGFVPGRIAIVQRGVQSFQTKVNNAIAAGAVGVIIYNNTTGLITPTLTASIPVIMITQVLGSSLVSQLSSADVTVSFNGGGAAVAVQVLGGAGTINGGGKSGFKYSTAQIALDENGNQQPILSCPGVANRSQYAFTPVPGIEFSHTLRKPVATLGDAYVDVVALYGGDDANGCLESYTLRCYDGAGALIGSIVMLDGITAWKNGTFNGAPLGNINLPVGTVRVDMEIMENSNRLDIPSSNCDAAKVFVGSTAWAYKLFVKE